MTMAEKDESLGGKQAQATLIHGFKSGAGIGRASGGESTGWSITP